jgi:hypothetical protein
MVDMGTANRRVVVSTGSSHRIECDGTIHWLITRYGTERDGPCKGKLDSRHA